MIIKSNLLHISFLVLILCGITYGNVFAENNTLLSIQFKDVTIPDALSEISDIAGVEIHLDGYPATKTISKSYDHRTLDEIFIDMFNDQSFVALFDYHGQTLDSVNIWFMPKADGMINKHNTIKSSINKQHDNRRTFNENGKIQKLEYSPGVSGSFKESDYENNREDVKNKNISTLPVRQSSAIVSKPVRSGPDNQNPLSDHNEISDADDNVDDDPSEQDELVELEMPPMPPGMISAEE